MVTIQEVNSAIISGKFSNDELNKIADAIKFARTQLTRQVTGQIRNGALVKFTNSRNGLTYTGTVTKVARKYITVSTNNGLWRVPGNMLSVA
jgi:exoribonuclease R